jgi:hypothetical protein
MRSLIFHLSALSEQASRVAHPQQEKLVSELKECVRRESQRRILDYQGKIQLDLDLDTLRERGPAMDSKVALL